MRLSSPQLEEDEEVPLRLLSKKLFKPGSTLLIRDTFEKNPYYFWAIQCIGEPKGYLQIGPFLRDSEKSLVWYKPGGWDDECPGYTRPGMLDIGKLDKKQKEH